MLNLIFFSTFYLKKKASILPHNHISEYGLLNPFSYSFTSMTNPRLFPLHQFLHYAKLTWQHPVLVTISCETGVCTSISANELVKAYMIL